MNGAEHAFLAALREMGRFPCALEERRRGLWFPGRPAVGFGDRLRGLLGTRSGHLGRRVLVLAPCRSIHTVGMAYAVDAAAVDADGTVLASVRGLVPGRVWSQREAWAMLEREQAPDAWLAKGDVVTCCPL